MTTASALPTVTLHGGASSPATLLGQAPARIPTAGKIRAGIKVLTKRAAGEPRACVGAVCVSTDEVAPRRSTSAGRGGATAAAMRRG